jgi:hypothetical protein
MTRALLVLSLLAVLGGVSDRPLHAATSLGEVRISPDVTVLLGGTLVNDENVAADDLAGIVSLVDVGILPAGSDVTAYDVLPNGDQLLSFDVAVNLPGGVTADPGDVVRFDGAVYSLVFDASASGLPNGVIADAITAIGINDFLLSFDVTVMVGGVTADGEDLVRFQNGVPSLFFDGSAAGIAPGLDLDGAHCLLANGHLLLSFDGSGMVAAVNFDDEDVLEFTPGSGSWELVYDGSTEHDGWAGADLDAVHATTAPPTLFVPPQIGGGFDGEGGATFGSTRVFGSGTARGKVGDICIAIFAVGANGAPDSPPGSVDDELLGVGGTDSEGNFVDASEAPGIGLSRPLVSGDRVFATDVCSGQRGSVVATAIPAPALSPPFLLIAVCVLGWIVWRRRRANV